jgi:hypothetical protein
MGFKRFAFVAAMTVAAVTMLQSTVSAAYLTPVIDFGKTLIIAFRDIGNGLAAVMFLYGGAKYIYTADDPGGRKQAMGICVAAIVAFLIIQSATLIICGITVARSTIGCSSLVP